MRKSIFIFAIFSLFLTACGSNPQSYIRGKSAPIVNVEAQIDSLVKVSAESDSLSVTSQSEQPMNLSYKLFWYDKNGVSQNGEQADWMKLWLQPKQTQSVELSKPTVESQNYRFYLRGQR